MANIIHYVYGGTYAVIVIVALTEESTGKYVLTFLIIVGILLAILISGFGKSKGER